MVKRPGKKLLADDPLAWMKEEGSDKKVTESFRGRKTGKTTRKKVKNKTGASVKRDTAKTAVKSEVKKAKENVLVLQSHARVDSAMELYTDMKSRLDTSQDLVIDAAQVDDIDTAILQLLGSLALSLDKAGHKVILKKPSGEFIDRIKLLGLEQVLGIEKY